MSEYRQDGTTGAWVVIAPGRGRRSPDKTGHPVSLHPDSDHDPSCPFCPGNEGLLPPIIAQTPADGVPGWSTRVVPNKHPALRPEGDRAPLTVSHQLRLAGFGYHEVIIESPRHSADLVSFSDTELAAVVAAWQARYRELSARPGIEAAFVYRRFGHDIRGSLRHPHTQVMATAIVPPGITAQAGWARERRAAVGHCATCKELGHEAADGQRVVDMTRRFLVAVPFAARSPYELRVTPFRHQASFADADPTDLLELGPVLRRATIRLRAALGNRPFSLAISSAAPRGLDAASAHWSLSIVPDLPRPRGFEIGSGLPINPSHPESDAAVLRAAKTG